MSRKGYIRTIVLLVLLQVLFYFYIGVYNTPHVDITHVKPEIEISSDKLLALFQSDESLANATYVEKTIEVEGVIKEITKNNNRYSVLLQSKNDSSHVICEMVRFKTRELKKLKPGQTVRIKGICKGFLMDVILLNCMLVKEETNE